MEYFVTLLHHMNIGGISGNVMFDSMKLANVKYLSLLVIMFFEPRLYNTPVRRTTTVKFEYEDQMK